MDDYTCPVMSACFIAKQLPIQHVRHHGEGMPIPGTKISKGSGYILEGNIIFLAVYIRDIELIVVINKFLILHRPINTKS